jgi:hypothetical protein
LISRGSPDVVAITEAIEGDLISPPLGAIGTSCPICCDWLDQPNTCAKCQHAAKLLGDDLTPVVPISLYVRPSTMRDRLTFYKDRRGGKDAQFATEVAALMDRFFLEHGVELQRRYGPIEASVVVPTRFRELSDHPLAAALDRLPAASVPPRERVLQLGSGKIDRRTPDPNGFVADGSVLGRSFVVLDDVYTTGATAQSAAHALRAAGATVPAIVVIGRRLNPTVIAGVGQLVERQRARGFRFARSPWS